MSLENVNIESVAMLAAMFGVLLLVIAMLMRSHQARQYQDRPKIRKYRQENVKLELVALDEEDVITEVINTLDYHQVPKSLLVEKARKLATGNN